MSATLRAVHIDVTRPESRFAERKPQPSANSPSPAELAVLRAVTYAGLFQFPLTPAEARRTLVGCALSETSLMALYRASEFLQARVEYRKGFFVPVGRGDWIVERVGREARSLRLIRAHKRFLNVLCTVPFIRLLAVSGSLAHLNATRDADLDLFIVTSGPRVWSVTVAVVLLAKVMGCRKTVCANFTVSDWDLVVKPQDEFAANQIIHLRPVIGAEAYREFLEANSFARMVYPGFDVREQVKWPFAPARWTFAVKRALTVLSWLPAGVVETACRVGYRWHLRRKISRWPSPDQVQLTRTQLKLHGNSHRATIAKKFDEALQQATGE